MSGECDKCGEHALECGCKQNIKSKRLTLEDRKKIEELLHKKVKHKDICRIVGIYPTTLYRDIKKCKESYNAEEAHQNTYQSKNLIDWQITGKRFGLLTVLEFANIYKKRSWWRCRCDCGKECIISRKMLTDYCSPKRPLSCGCVPKQGVKVPIEEAALRKFHDLLNFRKINRECWEWTGYKQQGKIPKTSWMNKGMTVRKCMYLLINGTTYEPNPVFTICGNLMCFNPDHLTLERPSKRQYYD
jgi:hypothetical protein